MKRLALLPALLVAFSGCMKVREELLVMPDGSGRIELHLYIQADRDAAKFTELELTGGDPDELMSKLRGLVALAKPTSETKDGVVHVRLTGYFDNLNDVKFMDEGEGEKAKPKQEFSFRREGEVSILEIKGNVLADDAPDRGAKDPELARQRDEFFKAMFAGFDFRQVVKLPGKITAVEGFQSRDERTATYGVGEKELQKTSDQKKINDAVRFKATCAKSEVSDEEAAEFRKELEKAKADWVELRKAMKKAAERRK